MTGNQLGITESTEVLKNSQVPGDLEPRRQSSEGEGLAMGTNESKLGSPSEGEEDRANSVLLGKGEGASKATTSGEVRSRMGNRVTPLLGDASNNDRDHRSQERKTETDQLEAGGLRLGLHNGVPSIAGEIASVKEDKDRGEERAVTAEGKDGRAKEHLNNLESRENGPVEIVATLNFMGIEGQDETISTSTTHEGERLGTSSEVGRRSGGASSTGNGQREAPTAQT